MVVLGSARLVCPHCGQVQYHPLARRYRCRACSKAFTAATARPAPRRAMGWLLLGLGACTMDNPLFGDDATGGGSGGSSSSATTGVGTTAAATSATTDATLDGTGNDATSAGETTLGTDPTDTDPTDTDPSDTESSSPDVPHACEIPVPTEIVILADDEDGPSDGACTNLWTSGEGALVVEGSTIRISNCPCPCAGEQTDHTLTVTGIDLGDLPECGFVTAYPNGSMASCRWSALVVDPALDAAPPALVASSSGGVPAGVLGGLTLMAGEDLPCGTGRCEKSGLYTLDFEDGIASVSVTMDEDPVLFPIPSLAGAPYLLDNVSAIVDDDCKEHVAWTARAP